MERGVLNRIVNGIRRGNEYWKYIMKDRTEPLEIV